MTDLSDIPTQVLEQSYRKHRNIAADATMPEEARANSAAFVTAASAELNRRWDDALGAVFPKKRTFGERLTAWWRGQ